MVEHKAVSRARNTGDTVVLILSIGLLLATVLVVFIVGALLVSYTASKTGSKEGVADYLAQSFFYFVIAIAVIVISLISIRIMRQMFLGNMLQVEYSNYAWLRDWCNQVSRELNMPRVEIFITQDPVMNAFAIGFMNPYNIVLNSGTIRYLTQDELKSIVLHEMGHVKYKHTLVGAYINVFRVFPAIGGFFGWILDFWGRRAELTADRLALFYMKDPELVKMALIKVHVGPDVASSFNQVARDWQAHQSFNWLNSVSQTLASHPFLVRRIRHIDQYSSQLLAASTTPTVQQNTPTA